jgi:hypothetical protein
VHIEHRTAVVISEDTTRQSIICENETQDWIDGVITSSKKFFFLFTYDEK